MNMDELVEKYSLSLKKSFITGFVTGAIVISALNLLFMSVSFDLNLFLDISGVIGLLAAVFITATWLRFKENQKWHLRKQVSKMFAQSQ